MNQGLRYKLYVKKNGQMGFRIEKRLKSFIYAFKGIRVLVSTQHNAWIHLFATICVISAGLLFRLSRSDWVLIIFAITLVWMAEALNTSIEFLGDSISHDKDEMIGKAKDIGAGAVLIATIGAVVVGIIVFTKYFM